MIVGITIKLKIKWSDSRLMYQNLLGGTKKISQKQDQGSKAPSVVHYITVKALTKLSSKLLHTYNFLP